jgi:hypothetical protein
MASGGGGGGWSACSGQHVNNSCVDQLRYPIIFGTSTRLPNRGKNETLMGTHHMAVLHLVETAAINYQRLNNRWISLEDILQSTAHQHVYQLDGYV